MGEEEEKDVARNGAVLRSFRGERGRRHAELLLILAAWTVFGLFAGSQRYFLAEVRGGSMPAGEAVGGALVEAYLWAVATVVIFWLARRFPLIRGRLARHLAVHLAAAVVLSLARALIVLAIANTTQLFMRRTLEVQLLSQFHQYILFYWLLLGIAWAVYYHAQYREREQAAERLAAGLTEARLQALKNQIHPHFVFNTLNGISALIPAEAGQARRMVARLGDLLRMALDHEATQEVTLQEELDFLEPYLEIEKMRLGERLTVELNIDPAILHARVPHLLLQPLVENAIRHGIAPSSEPGVVRLCATPNGRALLLVVTNSGGGRRRSTASGNGLGLSNIRSRLEQLYGAGHRFSAGPTEGGGWEVSIEIPFILHRAGASTAAGQS